MSQGTHRVPSETARPNAVKLRGYEFEEVVPWRAVFDLEEVKPCR